MKFTEFLLDPEAEDVFAKLDAWLREGVHIQKNEKQSTYFYFIAKHKESLEAYYQKFLSLYLTKAGEQNDPYYFLEFNNAERGPVDKNHRHFLKPEYVIAGFLLFRLAITEARLELDTVEKFQRILRTECEDMRPHLNRLFTKLRTSSSSLTADDCIDAVVKEAVREFEKLGWLLFFEDDTFQIQPSFFRLQMMYGDYINDVDNLIKSHSEKNPKTT